MPDYQQKVLKNDDPERFQEKVKYSGGKKDPIKCRKMSSSPSNPNTLARKNPVRNFWSEIKIELEKLMKKSIKADEAFLLNFT